MAKSKKVEKVEKVVDTDIYTHLLVVRRGKWFGFPRGAFYLDARDFNDCEGIFVGTPRECERYREKHPNRIATTHMTLGMGAFEEKRWRIKRWFKVKIRNLCWKVEDWIDPVPKDLE